MERPSAPKTVAAVDLGSNSFHMIIARAVEGGLHTLDRMREMVQLARGLDETGYLTPEAQARGIACLQRFGERLRGMPPGSVRAVGTNTLRKAQNAASFLRDAREALGHPIEIIAGREEARLIYLGVSHSSPDHAGNRLVIDIGGGSTEYIIGEGFEPYHRESLTMGCVSYSQRFFRNGELNQANQRAAETAAALELLAIRPRYRAIGWLTAVGSSGTVGAIAEILRANHWSNDGITLQGLHELRRALLAAGRLDHLSLPGLRPERVAVLPGGLAILLASFESLEIGQLAVSDGALREGLLYDHLGRLLDEDVRDRTIRQLVRRYHVDLAHARRILRTALQLLDQVQDSCRLPQDEHRNMLSWATLLHELGLAIAHSGYHKHGAYLIANSDMPGFSHQEQQFLAAIIRGHRQRFPKRALTMLPEGLEFIAWRLAVILRIAALLHRSRPPEPLPDVAIRFKLDKLAVRLTFPDDWLENHPLIRADLERNVVFFKDAGMKLRF